MNSVDKTTPLTGEGVLGAAQRGEPWAEGEIVRLVRAFARHLSRAPAAGGAPEPEWEDVAQEACRRVFASGLKHYRPGGNDRGYLYSIVKATRIQIYRGLSRRRRRELAVEIDETVEPEVERRTLLYRLLGRLGDTCRALLQRAFFDGASYEELAVELGLVESSVRSRVTRCLQQARAQAESK